MFESLKMEMLKHLHCVSFFVLSFLFVVHAHDQSGFISIDCGLPKNSSYTEPTTGIKYISDAGFINSGTSESISPEYKAGYVELHMTSVRSFPHGIRNCYTINVRATRYLIRASFFYGNYDGQNKLPQFDLHFGANIWDTVKFDNSPDSTKEIIHFPLQDYVRVCLVNTGKGTPFISALELRPFPDEIYGSNSWTSLKLLLRYDIGQYTRYPDDIFDRLWMPYFSEDKWAELTTPATFDNKTTNLYQPPSRVLQSAATPLNTTSPLEFNWESLEDASAEYFVYMHFAELQHLKAKQSRAFNILLGGSLWYGFFSPEYLRTTTFSLTSMTRENFTFSLVRHENSTLPPILNAIEVYILTDFSQQETDQDDVNAINHIKSAYGVDRNWEGDPCGPVAYIWAGLMCSDKGLDTPRIISLNLSSRGLSGTITSYISGLTELQTLDLSNNNLSGPVPDYLSRLPNLRVLNLERNNLTGSVPAKLIERSNDGSLSLSVGDNLRLCASVSCKKKKENNILIPTLASVGGLVILLLIASTLMVSLKRQKRRVIAKPEFQNDSFESRKRQYTYSEILKITNDFERVLSEGGFGMVYHGLTTDDTEVAVKMLSPSSVQGYQQFQAEVKLLVRVHHRNLTNLVGYCNEGTNMALVYEYMSNGDLHSHLSDNSNVDVLSWEGRLKIALDAAQGLEYLHHGCKPPIVHRDVKTTNILLSDNFQAKIADFGLSRCFPTDGGTHVSTVVVGTPGYLDPEYYVTNRLNEKSDAYSFGIVLLEIITGQPAIVRSHEKAHISQWVSFKLSNGDIRSVVDQRLNGDFEINSVWKAVEMAMACVSPTSIKRPNMNQVVVEIQDCLTTELSRKNKSLVTDSTILFENFSIRATVEFSPLAR